MSKDEASETGVPGCAGCVPLTTHEQVAVLKLADCQQARFVGCAGCVPLTSQEQLVVLNVAVCQQERFVGAGA